MAVDKELYQFINCRLLCDHSIVDYDLWVRRGKIVNPERVFFDEKVQAGTRIDCKNAIIAPGFIDLQINGGYGVDFSSDVDTVSEGISKVAKGLVAHGVTSFCPTIVSSPQSVYHRVLPRIPKHIPGGAGVLGIHLEGPFISKEKKGAHPEDCLKSLDNGFETLLTTYGSLENVRIVTLAPEKDVSGEVIKKLTELGITVALGHSVAGLVQGEVAAMNGASLITHLFNAMLPFHHRDPGLVGLLASDRIPKERIMYYGIISDGVHTHPAALRIAHRTHPDGLILVTDAISALGLEEGIHHIGQFDLKVTDGKAFVAGTNTLCGSIAPLDECVRIFKKSTGCSTVNALEAASLHPARCLGIERTKGTLNFDSDADFVMLDEDLRVQSTWINGECVYRT